MNVKELIEKLKQYDEKAIVSIDFTYNDSDEGLCYVNIDEFDFEFAVRKDNSFLTIKAEEWKVQYGLTRDTKLIKNS